MLWEATDAIAPWPAPQAQARKVTACGSLARCRAFASFNNTGGYPIRSPWEVAPRLPSYRCMHLKTRTRVSMQNPYMTH
ncbi:hypothetical protein M407DRAFT_247046 [Tulasnella calospora MUT 4182]|uniref:Uncharacterized protein n=1 Tax=Tulasnella calospora MUT 4182 TaxID=1051891 RepID=A0A0C3PNZ5_9AGAM|nr:hypothetical protein M407DRAFT_247046 [Tulasnella calospora MUT 4182]